MHAGISSLRGVRLGSATGLTDRGRNADILASFQATLTINQVVHTIDHQLYQLNLPRMGIQARMVRERAELEQFRQILGSSQLAQPGCPVCSCGTKSCWHQQALKEEAPCPSPACRTPTLSQGPSPMPAIVRMTRTSTTKSKGRQKRTLASSQTWALPRISPGDPSWKCQRCSLWQLCPRPRCLSSATVDSPRS